MASRLVRSLFWIVSFSGLGYTLLKLTTPSEADIQKLREELNTSKEKKEQLTKNQQFMNVLLAASDTNKPIYRMQKKDIEKEIKGE